MWFFGHKSYHLVHQELRIFQDDIHRVKSYSGNHQIPFKRCQEWFPETLLMFWDLDLVRICLHSELLLPHQKRRKCLSWIKLINHWSEKGCDQFSIFFPSSTMWPVQSKIAMIAEGLLPYMVKMFKSGIPIIVAPASNQLSPNTLSFSVATLLML